MTHLLLSEADLRRFRSFVETGDGCWRWNGAQSRDGRGRFMLRGRNVLAPRVAWVIANGRNPDGFVCHACDNPNCVNPAHLWVGTAADNTRDAVAKGRLRQQRLTHCPKGHPYSPENTIIRIHRDSRERACRECHRARGRERMRRVRATNLAAGLTTKGKPYAQVAR